MTERSIHIVGGVPLDAHEVFERAGTAFGPLAKRLPDGEKKRGWLRPTMEDFAMLRLVLLALLPQIGGILLLVGRHSALKSHR